MTTWYRLTVTTQQRISLGVGGERAYLTRTHPYIPGGVIRGALATTWLTGGAVKATDKNFVDLFTHTRFSPVFPAGVSVEPQSVSRCKYHDASAQHEEYVDLAFDPDPTVQRARQYSCGVESLKGEFSSAVVATKISTAIEPSKGTALDSNLFAREAIEGGETFSGMIVSDSPEVAGFHNFPVRLGGRRSVLGMGKVAIEECPAPTVPAVGESVVLRTVSPTFLIDEYARPTADLIAVLEAKGLIVRREDVWARRTVTESTGGWHMASGLPKPHEVGLAPGAVVRLTITDTTARETIRELLESGWGLRRNEGFGWIEMGEPWTPPRRKATALPAPSEPQRRHFLTEVNDLHLTSEQKTWLANLLLDVRAQDKAVIDKALTQPAGRWLSDHQRRRVREILTDLPDASRAALRRQVRQSLHIPEEPK